MIVGNKSKSRRNWEEEEKDEDEEEEKDEVEEKAQRGKEEGVELGLGGFGEKKNE